MSFSFIMSFIVFLLVVHCVLVCVLCFQCASLRWRWPVWRSVCSSLRSSSLMCGDAASSGHRGHQSVMLRWFVCALLPCAEIYSIWRILLWIRGWALTLTHTHHLYNNYLLYISYCIDILYFIYLCHFCCRFILFQADLFWHVMIIDAFSCFFINM